MVGINGSFTISRPCDAVVTPTHNAAVVLAGCGHRDGSEITEAATLLVALSAQGFGVQIFAPDRMGIGGVINHRSGLSKASDHRNLLDEAARIARGQVRSFQEFVPASFDALLFAGGFGAASQLSNFSTKGKDAALAPDVAELMAGFYGPGKVLGALCIAPVLLGLFAQSKGIKGLSLTLGDGSARDAVAALDSWGVRHVPCHVRQACIDPEHRMVSAPAYMFGAASPADILCSSEALVQGVRHLLSVH
jgi:enhancing lycopene biosynthesis protein 2